MRLLIACVLIAIAATGVAHAADARGAGSTIVDHVLSKWAEAYRSRTGQIIGYQAIGSSLGIKRIQADAVDFGASDKPLNPEELASSGLGQFPIVIGGVVPVVNLGGIKSGELRFSGALLADIYLGKVRRWDHPSIKLLNPELKLPSTAISVVHRTDGSGTTFNWVNYLSKVSPEWKTRAGEGTMVDWPLGIGGKGNDGVAALVEQINGAIGYVEYSYALRSKLKKLSYGLVQNKAGAFISPTIESFQAAARTANWSEANEFHLVMTDAPGEAAYPITATAFILMRKQPQRPESAAVAMDFFKWVLENGQPTAEALNYVPLPGPLVDQIRSYWKSQFRMIPSL
jgi:phosphate transport system substrate-binding protein